MHVLFYDTETNGITLNGVESDDPRQPKIVQLGAIVYDTDAGAEVARIDKIIRPEGWTIPSNVAAIHGISTERAHAEGKPQVDVIGEFLDLWRTCDHRVGFNESFDRKMVRIHLKTFSAFWGGAVADAWLFASANCMKIASGPVCMMPPTPKQMRAFPYKKWKDPKLTEAHEIILGRKHEGAHGAIADALGTLSIWLKLRELGKCGEPRCLERRHDDGLAEERAQKHDAVSRRAPADPLLGSELF